MSQNFVPCIALVEFHGDAGYVKMHFSKLLKTVLQLITSAFIHTMGLCAGQGRRRSAAADQQEPPHPFHGFPGSNLLCTD